MGIQNVPGSTNELLDKVGEDIISVVANLLLELNEDLKLLDGAEYTSPEDGKRLSLDVGMTIANVTRNVVEDVHDVIANIKLELMFKHGQINREPGIPLPNV